MLPNVETGARQSLPRDVSCHPAQDDDPEYKEALEKFGLKRASDLLEELLEAFRNKLPDLEALLRRVIWLPDDAHYPVLVIWALYTHVYHKFMHAPRLFIHSPVSNCGKSTLLSVLKALVRQGKIEVTPTQAIIFRQLDATHPTLMFDEADKYLHGGNSDVLAVLNAGHLEDSAEVSRCMGDDHEVETYNVFGPLAFALKGRELPDDLANRCIRIDLVRAPKRMQSLDVTLKTEFRAWHVEFVKWANVNGRDLGDVVLELPDDLINRGADNWRPLLTVAKAVGGDWYERIMAAALKHERGQESTDRNTLLLEHLKAIWPKDTEFWWSHQIVSELNKNEEWPWAEYDHGNGITANRLARMLKQFKIRPDFQRLKSQVSERETNKPGRGYWHADLAKVGSVQNLSHFLFWLSGARPWLTR